MTSNIGTRDIKSTGGFGFGLDTAKDKYESMKNTVEDAVKRVFNPEFLNRIDDTIVFHSLERDSIMRIIDIQMKDLVKRMHSMNITIELVKAAKEFLVEKGYDPTFGARPLKRALQKYVEDPLAEEILKGKFTDGAKVKVKFDKKKEQLRFVEATKGKTKKDDEIKQQKESAGVA